VTGNEANASLLNVVLTHYGVPLDKVQISQIEPKNIASAIADNQVDALFVAGPAPGHAIGEAVAAATRNGVAPGFIEIDQADAIASVIRRSIRPTSRRGCSAAIPRRRRTISKP
jgi:TRAP-type uncharacterized transport system substrate-binding protein